VDRSWQVTEKSQSGRKPITEGGEEGPTQHDKQACPTALEARLSACEWYAGWVAPGSPVFWPWVNVCTRLQAHHAIRSHTLPPPARRTRPARAAARP